MPNCKSLVLFLVLREKIRAWLAWTMIYAHSSKQSCQFGLCQSDWQSFGRQSSIGFFQYCVEKGGIKLFNYPLYVSSLAHRALWDHRSWILKIVPPLPENANLQVEKEDVWNMPQSQKAHEQYLKHNACKLQNT